MTNLTVVNNREESPVTCDSVTNWNGEEVEEYVLPEFDREVGDEVLDEVESLIDEFVFATPRDRTLLTLWTGHANVFDWFRFTPRLGVTAGEGECGKSQALQTCRLLTNKSHWIGDTTGASFYTNTQHGDKAVFLDEMQDMLAKDRTLVTALKTGTQSNGVVTRVDMGNNGGRTNKQFRTYAAVGFNGVGVDRYVDGQMHSRTHWVYMRKAFSDEQRELLDERFEGDRFKDVGGRYLKWLHQNEQKIKAFKTSDLPPFIMNRGRQKWLPLFAIANVVGGKWLEHICQLADEESAISNELTDNTQVLLAIQDINENWDRYSSKEPRDRKIAAWKLAQLLTMWKDESGFQPYAKFHKGSDPEDRVIARDDLLKLLRPFARTKRNRSVLDTKDRSSGYEWADLLDAADRHLPDEYRLLCHADPRDNEVQP